MIRLCRSLVYLTAHGTEGLAIDDVINAYDKRTCMEGEPKAIPTLYEGILHPLRDLPMDVGERGVVEVSTDNHAPLRAIGTDVFTQDICLHVMCLNRRAKLGSEGIL